MIIMEQELNNSRVHLEKNEINEFFKEVKETLARDVINETNNKSFSTTDLWNIRRSKKRYLRRATL
jgi:hypothetical protein